MSTTDEITLAVIALSLLSKVAVDVAAWLRDRHDSALARLVGFAGRVAGEASEAVRAAPAGADAGIVAEAVIAAGVKEGRAEFASSQSIVGGDDAVLATMIRREFGKLLAGQAPAPAAGPAQAATAVAAPAAA